METMPISVDACRRRALQFAALGLITAASGARAAYEQRAWPKARPAPPLALSDLDGRPWTLAALRGRPVMLNFWASWCEPCRAEMPSLDLLAARHEHDGLVVLTVNFKDGELAIRRFLDAVSLTLPVLLDRDGAAARAWDVTMFPTTLLIDRRGSPHSVVRGEVDWTGEDGRTIVALLLAS
jgi:thiol-disulfide isomerase/thioredoxin